MTVYQFIVAVMTGLPGLLAGIASFYHSMQTRTLVRRLALRENPPYGGGY